MTIPSKRHGFIASSSEGKEVAAAIRSILDPDFYITLWTQDTFYTGSYTIPDLVRKMGMVDFGIFVVTPDDKAMIRADTYTIGRDNVLLEAGMSIMRHGQERCFLVCPRDVPDFHLPSDLSGVTVARYDSKLRPDVRSALGAPCDEIKASLRRLEHRSLHITATAMVTSDPKVTYGAKVLFKIRNPTPCPVVMISRFFDGARSKLRIHPDHQLRSHADRYKLQLQPVNYLLKGSSTPQDVYRDEWIIPAGDWCDAWIPLEPRYSESDIETVLAKKNLGAWHYTCVWLEEPVGRRDVQDDF